MKIKKFLFYKIITLKIKIKKIFIENIVSKNLKINCKLLFKNIFKLSKILNLNSHFLKLYSKLSFF